MMIKNQKGLTLTELLVASFLVGIVMLGVIGFNVAMTTMQDTSSKASTGSVHVAAATAALRRDIENAIGDFSNPGILNSGQTIIALRREQGGTPDVYAGDDWICWAVNNNGILTRSLNPTFLAGRDNSPPPNNRNQCLNGGTQISFMSTINTNFFRIQRDATNRIQFVEVTLTTRPNTATPADPLSNPQTTYETKISPMMTSE